MQFDRGYLSRISSTAAESDGDFEKPLILLCDKKISNIREMPSWSGREAGRPLIVVAEDVRARRSRRSRQQHPRHPQACSGEGSGLSVIDRKAMLQDIATLPAAP